MRYKSSKVLGLHKVKVQYSQIKKLNESVEILIKSLKDILISLRDNNKYPIWIRKINLDFIKNNENADLHYYKITLINKDNIKVNIIGKYNYIIYELINDNDIFKIIIENNQIKFIYDDVNNQSLINNILTFIKNWFNRLA